MLGLEGYGSGSDDDSGDDDGGGRVTLMQHSPSPERRARSPSPPSPRRNDPTASLDLTGKLPAPKVTTGSLFASMPKSKDKKNKGAGGRRVISLKPTVDVSALNGADTDDDEDEDRAAKRRKTGGPKGAGLRSMLPKPKNALGAGGDGRGLDVGSGGGGGALGSGFGDGGGGGGGAMLDLGGDDHRGEAGPSAAEPAAPHPSQLYAVDESGAYAYDAQAQAQYHAQYAQYYGHSQQVNQGDGPETHGMMHSNNPEEAGRGAVDGSNAGGFDVDAVMRRAGVDGSVVKGVSAAQLRSGGGDRIRENATTGLAFDDEYRDKLTKDGGHAPSLAHKSKNQIGSLLYNAKQAELKIMEGRLQGVSHKAQARQKYGW